MEERYFLGEPSLRPKNNGGYFAPTGQLKICFDIIKETQDRDKVLDELRKEYVAIILTMKEMGVDFRIIYSHPRQADKNLISLCVGELGCKVERFTPNIPPCFTSFPRDFAVFLPGLILMNSSVVKFPEKKKENIRIISSPYGEGGRMLTCGNTALISKRILSEDGKTPVKSRKPRELIQVGMEIGFFPPSLAAQFTAEGKLKRVAINDHIDRVTCLIEGEDGKFHLVVDPRIQTLNWKKFRKEKNGKVSYGTLSSEGTQKIINSLCERLGIEVHYPEKIEVPCSLNLIQFSAGKVLMTGGDESVAGLIDKIVGKENVFKTALPIRFFPAWRYGGIRCLVNELPDVIFKSITSV